MLADTNIAFGICTNFAALRTAVDRLRASGFRNSDITVLFPEAAVARTFLPSSNHASSQTSTQARPAPETKENEPFIGGTLSALTYVNPAGRGDVSAALESLGVSRPEAARYEGQIRNGGLLVCVRSSAAGWIASAKQILEQNGAVEISCSVETPLGAFNSTPSAAPLAKAAPAQALRTAAGHSSA